MSTKAKFMLVTAVVAGALLVLNLRPSPAQVETGAGKMFTLVLEGNYRVKYDCTFMDKKSKTDKEELIKKIEFHPEYVVLMNQYGGGRLIPVHAIKELTWEPS